MVADAVSELLLQRDIDNVHPYVRAHTASDAIRDRLQRQLSANLSRCNDTDFATKFRDACLVEGTTTNDYLYRIITIPELGTAVTSIRFRGMNMDFPFVQIEHSTFATHSSETLAILRDKLNIDYKLFAPKFMRISGTHNQLMPDANGYIDHWTVAGTIDELRANALPENFKRVSIRAAGSTNFYPRYSDTYDQFHNQQPNLSAHVLKEPEERLKDLVDQSLLYHIYVDDEDAGLIAVERDAWGPIEGYCIIEQVLHPEFRGAGWAPAAQRAVIEALDCSDDDYIFGTINGLNSASLRTALRVGRIVIGSEVFYPMH